MEQLLKKVSALSEIELLEFMEGLAAHIAKQNIEHLIDQVFDPSSDEFEDLKSEYLLLEFKKNRLENELQVAEAKIENIRNICLQV